MVFGLSKGSNLSRVSKNYPREAGYGHWRWQRVSAVITLLLMGYFTYLMISIGSLDYAGARTFVATPHQGIALSFLVAAGLFQAALGVQMIIEDYVPLASGRAILVSLARGIFCTAALASFASISLVAGWI